MNQSSSLTTNLGGLRLGVASVSEPPALIADSALANGRLNLKLWSTPGTYLLLKLLWKWHNDCACEFGRKGTGSVSKCG
jgi:hypothetical protein